MVEFLQDVGGTKVTFWYEKGKRYVSLHDHSIKNKQDSIFVRQPNSPKNRNLWTEFDRSCEGEVFRILDDDEIDFFERMEEDRLLQL